MGKNKKNKKNSRITRRRRRENNDLATFVSVRRAIHRYVFVDLCSETRNEEGKEEGG